jgi:hypothetical protein
MSSGREPEIKTGGRVRAERRSEGALREPQAHRRFSQNVVHEGHSEECGAGVHDMSILIGTSGAVGRWRGWEGLE